MPSFEVTTCMTEGCDAPLPGVNGTYYCADCIERQSEAHRAERQAFEDYHAYADAVARSFHTTKENR